MADFLHAQCVLNNAFDLKPFSLQPTITGRNRKMGSTKENILGNLLLIKIRLRMFKLAFLKGLSLRLVKVFH
jgi:hypothetical protein